MGENFYKGEVEMKELALAGQASGKMTSVEIAELTGKKHAHVMRDIKTLIEQDAIGESSFGLSSYVSEQGKELPMYSLGFKATMTLVTGYDAKRRSVVIDRWVDLETGKATTAFSLPTNYKEALLELVSKVEENEKLQLAITEQAPTVAAYDRIATVAVGSMCITDAAKALQVQPQVTLFPYLSGVAKWIYRRVGGKGWVGYQDKVQQGLLEHKVTEVTRGDGTTKIIENVLITPKGLAKLAKTFSSAEVAW